MAMKTPITGLSLPSTPSYASSQRITIVRLPLRSSFLGSNDFIMALRIAGSHTTWSPLQPITASERALPSALAGRYSSKSYNRVAGVGFGFSTVTTRRKPQRVVVRSSLEAVAGDSLVGTVTEVNNDTFWPIVNGAGDKTVVLDMYTQWCGPCKIIAPKFQELSEKYLDCIFLKLDCNQDNKPLAKELGIRVVPTFKILKHKEVVKEVTGAKIDDLVAAIETVRSS